MPKSSYPFLSRKIPLLDSGIVPSLSPKIQNQITDLDDASSFVNVTGATSFFDLKITCIEEERLGLGIDDFVELIISPNTNGFNHVEPPLGPFKVIKVDSSKSVVLSVDIGNKGENQVKNISHLIDAVKQGRVTMKKVSVKYSS